MHIPQHESRAIGLLKLHNGTKGLMKLHFYVRFHELISKYVSKDFLKNIMPINVVLLA